MSLFVASLNSGSNGNCYYIGNDNEAVLIDAGISCRETEKRMKRLGLSMNKVKAIFISHEHGDHILGIPVLSTRYNLPVYVTDITLRHSNLKINGQLTKSFSANEAMKIGQLSIHPFPKQHDAADPHSFIITHNDVKVGVFTDIGAPCQHVIDHFKQCNAAFLEANYDEAMLEQGRYPIHLKRRISGDEGHLSNRQALELFTNHKSPFMSHLFLSHLSKDNNDPNLVADLFNKNRGETNIVVASRYKETEVYHIGQPDELPSINKHRYSKKQQLSLF